MRKPYSAAEFAEVEAHLRSLILPFSSFRSVQDELNSALEIGQRARQDKANGRVTPPRCIALIAPQRSGKSRALQHFCGCGEAGGLGRNGAAYVSLQDGLSGQSISRDILTVLNDQQAGKRSLRQGSNVKRVVNLLEPPTPCQLLVLDNASKCFNRDTNNVSQNATKFIRSLAELTGIPVVCAGNPDLYSVLESDRDLKALVSEIHTMPPADIRESHGAQEFVSILRGYEDILPLPSDSSSMTAPSMVIAIHSATGGLIGNISKLVIAAFKIFSRRTDGPPTLTWDDFAAGYEVSIAGKLNPFLDRSLRTLPPSGNKDVPSNGKKGQAV